MLFLKGDIVARDDYFVIVYSLLSYLYEQLKAGKRPEKSELTAEQYGIPEQYWIYILDSLLEQGFTKGYKIQQTKFGIVHTDLQDMQITPCGIQYLFDNTLFEKAKKTLKDIKDTIPLI